MRPFVSPGDGSGTYVAGLSTPERLVLAQVTGDVVELLGGEESLLPGDAEHTDAASETDAFAERAPAAAISALRDVFAGLEGAPVEAPADPAVRRLLPDASSDPEVAEEFRRYTDDDLRLHKVERLLFFAELLLEVPPSADENTQLDFVVMGDEAEAIAGALADIRLVIGERLGLRTDRDSEELYDAVTATWEAGAETDDAETDDAATDDATGPRLFLGSVFLLAGYLQESLTDCLLEDFRRRKRRR